MKIVELEAATILKVRHGSHAYGTNIEGSDLDLRGIAIPPLHYQFGFLCNFEQAVCSPSRFYPDQEDVTIFSLKKFIKLASECNPNAIEILYVDESDVLKCSAVGRMLLDGRDMFLTRRARHTFSGYAHAQLKRIKSHRGWLLTPPKEPPERAAFGLPLERTVSESEMGAFDAMKGPLTLPDNVLHLYILERQYRGAKRVWDQYQQWIRLRNPERAALEARSGYDTKHGMHLIRLMRMCCEILRGEGVRVRRDDADELKAIRAGAWSYEKIVEEAEKLEAECLSLYADSKLPREPDWSALDRLCVALTCEFYGI